ncbi:hypothetical protein ACPCUV_36320 [Streptomyces platensis]|uniref:hypothetical protein n=1 Tax=Streptomyces platensis TaxID=58346 RepID=UPI003C2ECC5C
MISEITTAAQMIRTATATTSLVHQRVRMTSPVSVALPPACAAAARVPTDAGQSEKPER